MTRRRHRYRGRLVLGTKCTRLKRDTLTCREERWVRRVMWVFVIYFFVPQVQVKMRNEAMKNGIKIQVKMYERGGKA